MALAGSIQDKQILAVTLWIYLSLQIWGQQISL